ncbi:MAG: tetratricopeptide repeat protein [Xenococcaceae cyanobacterium]
MDIANFLTWFIVIAAVMGIGLGAMIWAYIGSGSTSLLFPNPVPAPPSFPPSNVPSELADYFQQGCDAYQAGNYRQAIDKFSQAIQLVSTFAEAYHNRGLAFANLRQDDDAVSNLVSAGEFYAQRGNQEGIAIVKQNLEALKAREQGTGNREQGIGNR